MSKLHSFDVEIDSNELQALLQLFDIYTIPPGTGLTPEALEGLASFKEKIGENNYSHNDYWGF